MIKQLKLKNGLKVVCFPLKGTRALSVMALLPIGARYESADMSGASHFVEHLMFDGTIKRPTSLDISRLLESEGADYNAMTNKEYTGYYVKINSERAQIAFDLLSDMLFNAKFEQKEVDKEKGVIVEELRMYEDNPSMAIDLLFDKIVFGDHPLGWDVGGTAQTVRALSREKLWSHYQKYYQPGNMVLVVAGCLPDKKKLKKYLDYFNVKSKIKFKPLKDQYQHWTWPKKLPLEKRVETQIRKLDQAQVMLGFPGLDYGHKDRYAVAVLTNILGVGMSSRLFVEVREKRGLAYMIRADHVGLRDCGIFQIQAGLDPARLAEALKVIKQELKKISSEKVSVNELKEAKSAIIGRMVLGFEDSSAVASSYAKQFWFDNRLWTQKEVFAKVRAVTSNDILRVAKNIFVPEQIRLATIGSFDKKEILKMI
ncbi:MAG: hypothetical protein COU31_04440 [Candidatus Magasanikbacteria bacterium CG10_big_fil_rev_8_21_14_0_10_40_10]|uniref:Peptidase M16 n=1 Tax=Candidatus Magasanikbacteria bacterium CG10_big_fil_rev_8_21_14_0_10_40_10 TaxID=1974648 RepID=A0A2M6W384_9BACT|nr:MAG: hypothetical protein COU31_04440 [Candidatus Magasanikbacteria bacterium CG10_big_fil_rev_8_21_14_0_10_40_10]